MEKIKQFIESDRGKDILTVLIVILVGLGSFGLGRLSKSASTGITVEYPAGQANAISGFEQASYTSPISSQKTSSAPISTSGNYFASTRGHKYYPVGCSAGKTIKQENRVYFATGEEAEKAGYELSSSCK